MTTGFEIGRDYTVSASGSIWTQGGLDRLREAGLLDTLGAPPQVHRILGDDVLTAMVAALPEATSFAVPPSVAATIREGTHFEQRGCSYDWTGAGREALRGAGWDGSLRTEPSVEYVLGSRTVSTPPRAAAAIPSAPAAPVTSARVAAPPASPAAQGPMPIAPKPALDLATAVMARRRVGDAAFAAMKEASAAIGPDPSVARTMAEGAALYWARYRAREAAGLCGRNGTPRAGQFGHQSTAAITRRTAKAEHRLRDDDAAEIYARRRQAARG